MPILHAESIGLLAGAWFSAWTNKPLGIQNLRRSLYTEELLERYYAVLCQPLSSGAGTFRMNRFMIRFGVWDKPRAFEYIGPIRSKSGKSPPRDDVSRRRTWSASAAGVASRGGPRLLPGALFMNQFHRRRVIKARIVQNGQHTDAAGAAKNKSFFPFGFLSSIKFFVYKISPFQKINRGARVQKSPTHNRCRTVAWAHTHN